MISLSRYLELFTITVDIVFFVRHKMDVESVVMETNASVVCDFRYMLGLKT